MLERIKNSFENFPFRTAANIKGVNYSYNEFASIISRIRKYIDSNISEKEKLIGISAGPNSDIGSYGSIFAALFGGKGFVPVNPELPIERNSSVIIQSGIKTIFCDKIDDKIIELCEKNCLNVININDLPKTEIDLSLPVISNEETAYVLFTSGSTGNPKGVRITRSNLNAFVEAFFNLSFEINENDRFLQMFDLTFDFSVVCYIIPLSIGASFYTVPSEGIKFANVYTTMEEYEITFACMVPSVLTYLKPFFSEIKLHKIRYSLFCGETLYTDYAESWSHCIPKGNIINAYGPTEATVFCITYNWTKYASDAKTLNGGVCIGKPMKGTSAIIVDEDLRPLNANLAGELCLAGQQLTPGYLNFDDDENKSFFKMTINGEDMLFYRTGDYAFKDSNGDFLFSGRIDGQVKIQGFRIELGEIEHCVREYAAVNAAAITYNNKFGSAQIHLYIEGYNGNINDLSSYLENKLPDYMMPAGISVLPNLPLTSNGKIDRKKLSIAAASELGIQ